MQRWLASTGFLPEISNQLRAFLQNELIRAAASEFDIPRIPTKELLDAISSRLDGLPAASITSDKVKAHIEKTRAAIRMSTNILLRSPRDASLDDLNAVFTSKVWSTMAQKIVTNAHRTDIHFLPPDEQDPAWTAIGEPSVILFRYPLTAPIELLDLAHDLSQRDWQTALSRATENHPIAKSFASQRPTRRSRLQDRFLADVMTRYLAVYIRLGSPDFTAETVASYSALLGGGR